MANNTIKGAGDIYEKDLYGDLAKSAKEVLPLLDKINEVLKQTTKTNQDLIAVKAKDVESLQKVNKGVNQTNKAFEQKLKLDKERIKLQNKLSLNRKKATQENEVLKVQIQEETRERKRLAKETLGLTGAYEKESKKLNDLRKKYKNLALSEKEVSKEQKDLLSQITKLDAKLKQVDKTVGQSQRNVGNYGSAFKRAGSALTGFAGALGITAGISGLVRVMGSAIKTAKDFEQGNANLASVLGTTKDNITALTDDAKRLGAATSFSATQVSELQTEFAKLGFNEQEILNATEATLDLAAATGSDLGEAAAIAGATLGGFGLDASETSRVTDVMAKSFSTSALDLEKFKESMKSAAPAAKAVGVSVEETTALLGTLANAGISGSKAGNNLKTSFINLNNAGLSLEEGLEKVAKSQDKLGTAAKLVGKNAAASFLVLAEGKEVTKDLQLGLENAGGAAKKMADEQLNTLEGRTKILSSAWEGFVLSLLSGDSAFSSISKGLVEVATNLLGVLTPAEELEASWYGQRDAVNDLESGLNPLLDRYDELTTQTELTKEEQKELDEIIIKVAEDVPSAVTEFDKYGNALKLSTNAARDFIQEQKDLLALDNAAAIAEQQEEIIKLINRQKALTRTYKNSEKGLLVYNREIEKATQGKVSFIEASDDEIRAFQKESKEIANNIKLRSAKIAKLRGEKTELEKKAEQEKLNNDLLEENTGLTDKNTDAQKRRQKELDDISRRIEDLNNKAINDELERRRKIRKTAFEREIKEIKGNSDKENQLRQALKRELDNDLRKIDKDYFDNLGKARKKDLKDERDIFRKKSTLAAEIAEEDRQKALEELKREEELQKQRAAIQDALLKKLEESILKRSEARQKDLEDQLEASENQQNRLRELADKGSLDAERSIAAETKKQAELQRAKEQEERKRELVTAGFKIFSALLDQGKDPSSATLETAALLGALPAIIEAVPAFYEGTESTGTVKNALDSNGGRLAMLHDNERVMTEKQNKKMGGISNDEAANIIQRYNMGELFDHNNVGFSDSLINSVSLNGMNKALESKIDELNQSIKNIKIPETTVKADELRNMLIITKKQGNKVEKQISKLH
jgi:hypothetical protein